MTRPDAKSCVHTGASSGIGYEVALALAAKGWRLALVGRDSGRLNRALEAIARQYPQAKLTAHRADLSSLDEVRRLAAELLKALPRIDVLINNAGAFFMRREVTPDGLEKTFALNHMAYFLLSEMLRERLIASAPARIINVASGAHRGGKLDFGNLQGQRRFFGWSAYQASKLCNVLHASELASQLAGTGVTANSLHPGFVASRFADNVGGVFGLVWSIAKRLSAISPQAGAATPLYLADSSEVEGISGAYFERCKRVMPSEAARSKADAKRLWQVSCHITCLPVTP